ncbi:MULTISPECIES: hypothetical protein [unclassified Rhizobium]|uniref:hypothetical protein n=1 Tax=unclassified Rhizobium TaxID=2613769 RepID=UPI00115EF10F|nr:MULTISPECIES: hypothetical protein [unclassified Rhizobium]TQX90253.1 hypothetical protein EQW76_11155 [Rhizobium sp. rho-13.1]TQY16203.1 hypothetical protein EQW74_10745 [Rhizobium sp. rho-1.1]
MKNFTSQNWVKSGIFITVIYVVVVGAWIAHNEPAFTQKFTDLKLNEIGDVLAGFFAPLAFFWLFVATMIQGQELVLTRNVMKEQSETSKQQAASAAEQVKFLEAQTAAMQTQADTAKETAYFQHRMAMFEKRVEVYNEFLRFANQHRDANFYGQDDYDALDNLRRKSEFIFESDIPSWLLDIVNAIGEAMRLQERMINCDWEIATQISYSDNEVIGLGSSQASIAHPPESNIEAIEVEKERLRVIKAEISSETKELDSWFFEQYMHDEIDMQFNKYLNLNIAK